MDPLSISASIVALLQLSSAVIRFLRDVKEAPDDLKMLMVEISSIKGLLLTLQDLVESGETELTTLQSLNAPNGPLSQCQSALKRLTEKFAPAVGLGRARNALTWPFQKSEVKEVLCAIERQKTLFSLALQNDHLGLSRAVKADVAELKGNVQDMRQDQKAGAGKTVLTSIVVDFLERSFEQQDVAIGFIYCSYKEQDNQKAVNLIASLLQQLVQRTPTISEGIMSAYQGHTKKQTRPTIEEYSHLLQSEIRRFSKVFIAVDALDECPESNGTRDSFITQIRKLQPNINLFVTSRHISTIEREFEKAPRVEIRASDGDIKTYIQSRIKRERRLLRHVKADSGLQEAIVNTIVEKAKGMFLLAQLHMDSLSKKLNRRDIRKAIEDLPAELDDIYDEAMRRIEGQDKEEANLAKRVLCWISYAFRPLTITEIQHGLAVEPGDADLNEETLPDEDDLISLCAGLVTTDRESNIIRLVHYTTQEYFERIRTSRFPHAHTDIARACLTYVSFDAFAEGCCSTDKELGIRMHKYPLLEYAAPHWGKHACGDPEGVIREQALEFLGHQSKVACSSQVIYLSERRLSRSDEEAPESVTGLHLLGYFGLSKIARLLLKCQSVTADSKDDYGRTPLSWAARNGHEAVVRLLAEREDVDTDSKDVFGLTPLSWAATKGHESVVQLLVKREDVDANSESRLWTLTPLSHAAKKGHEAVVRLLAEHEGVDADFENEFGQTPLSWAASKGHEAVVRLLVEREDVNVGPKTRTGNFRMPPLMYAAAYGHEAAVRLLVGRGGIDIDYRDESGKTSLLWAARGGHEAVVRLLAEREDVNADSQDGRGRTPLSWAAENGHEAVVRLLAERGDVDIDSKDTGGGLTPLSWAAREGHEAVVRLLIGYKGVDIESRDEDGWTPLAWAVRRGRLGVVRLLVQRASANPNSKDNKGQKPLSLAMRHSHKAVIAFLAPLTSDS
ncbi:hypothetical protein FGG08_004250 [Glutinoglossum americanum]|uniref:NACHT domain-containing protein n=1 Tax=Glutinoglossum americanum TaxID=1670608 RepID=A0A9P8I7X1_9PEZI|nr:hypothetical protein FGG08_004250 [Glutinoglossum americanum]